MRVTEVSYKMLRVTKQYENDTAEVTILVGPMDDTQKALEMARKECTAALMAGRAPELKDQVDKLMATAYGRERLATRIKGLL